MNDKYFCQVILVLFLIILVEKEKDAISVRILVGVTTTLGNTYIFILTKKLFYDNKNSLNVH